MNSIKEFKKSFRSYYLELERQFIETKRDVEFSSDNDKAYSVEYLKLYQAICSKLDVDKHISVKIEQCYKKLTITE